MPELPHDEEILDLVDIKDRVVGNITHEAAFNPVNLKGNYLRAVNAFIINEQGRLWIPRRTPDKKIAPSGLDYSIGEHVMSGESYDTAIVRGFEEELNMAVQIADLTWFFTAPPLLSLAPYFNINYFYRSDEVPSYNPKDFTGYEWLKPQELIDRIEGGEKAKTSIIGAVEALMRYQAENTGH